MSFLNIRSVGMIALIGTVSSIGLTAQSESHYEEEYEEYEPLEEADSAEHFWKPGRNQRQIFVGGRATQEGGMQIAEAIEDTYGFCIQLRPPEYLVDCLAEQLQEIADALRPTGDYAEAKEILEEAAEDLRALARANVDPTKPLVRASGRVRGKRITTKPLVAVRPERAAAVKLQAADILAEAETKLLRSAETSDRRLIAYAQMAKAVGSNKTLLRSA